jgi:hypothetical protein
MAEVRDGEGDQSALGAVDETLLDQAVTGGREARRLAAELVGDVRGGYGFVAEGRHRPHVVALGGRGAFVPAAEEADGELAFGLRRRDQDVTVADRRLGCDVPGDLAVRLDEVGVAVGGVVQRVEGVLGKVTPSRSAGARSARSAAARSSRSMRA